LTLPNPRKENLEENIRKLESRQGNVKWPDFIRAGKSADEVMLKRSLNKPLVQRIGGLLFGIALASIGIILLTMRHSHPLIFVVAGPMVLLGGYLIWVAFN
jgi:hypothetical protein